MVNPLIQASSNDLMGCLHLHQAQIVARLLATGNKMLDLIASNTGIQNLSHKYALQPNHTQYTVSKLLTHHKI